jgi:hypothetical protein
MILITKTPPLEWLAGSLVFARALSLTLQTNEAVVVQASGDTIEIFGDELLLVINNGEQIQIIPLSETDIDVPLKEGDFITLT